MVILNTIDDYSWEVINQARSLGMMGEGWAWIVTDGTTTGLLPVSFLTERRGETCNVSPRNDVHAFLWLIIIRFTCGIAGFL